MVCSVFLQLVDLPEYRFGAFEVRVETGELRKNGRRIHLQRKPFEILAALLEQPGKLMSRESLRQRLWPADTFVDFDNGLNTALSKLRQALGDTAGKPRYIETFEGRGYRFVPLVERMATPPANQVRELDVQTKLIEADVVLVELAGKIVYGPECRQIEWLTTELIEQVQKKIVFDLSRVTHLDSSGIGILVMCSAKARQAGAELRIAGAGGHVKDILKVAEVGKILSLHATMVEALEGFGSTAA